METLLCLVHTEPDGSLARPALEAITAARDLGAGLSDAPWHLGLFGGEMEGAQRSVSGCGAQRILAVLGGEFAVSRYASDAAAGEALVKASAASVVIAPHTPRIARVIAGVAQRLGGRVDTHVTSLKARDSSISVERSYYRQRILARLSRARRPWFIALESGFAAPFAPASGDCLVERVSPPPFPLRTEVKGLFTPEATQQTIRPDADLLFVAGAGWTKPQADKQTHLEEAEALILEFLKQSQASLGGSKSLVDLSGGGQAVLRFMTQLNQVGQTGSMPRHPKGLSACCHGEEPHTVGWRFIAERRAINKDANCGWARGKADVLYVADAFDVMARVNALLAQRTKSPGPTP